MLLKKVSIPLDDLRLHKSEDSKILVSSMACDQKSDNPASDEENESEENCSNLTIKQEESEEEEESYEVKKVRGVKVVKIISSSNEDDDDKNKISDSEEEEKKMKKRYQKRKTVRKKLPKCKIEDDDSEDSDFDPRDDDSEDSDFDPRAESKKLTKCHSVEKNVPVPTFYKKKGPLSAYELMIQKNREEKMAFLQSIKIEEAKAGLSEIVGKAEMKKKTQPVKRKFQKVKNPTSPPVLRKSRRLSRLDINLSEDSLYSNALKTALEVKQEKIIPPEMTFKEALESEEFYESYKADVNIKESKAEAKFCLYDKSVLNKMKVSESNIAKVTPARITGLTWYPSPEQMILAAGDKYGNLGIWNVDSESNPYVLKIHLEGITNLQFNPFNHVQLISSSYDGVLRCGDMIQHNFKEIYNVSDETCCTYFDFLSATTYLVAQRNGQVALVDKRTEGKSCEKKHKCHDFVVKTVNIHPVNKNYFVTAENKGPIRLWDLRKLQSKPVADITHHKRCTHSAFFSPVLGNSILATSTDNSVSIFDSTNLTSDIQLAKQMTHDNNTGRWLSIFRATWLPNSEEAFVIGSMQYPRRIEVFDKNMFVYCLMKHDNLTTITSTNAFHPMRPALAGGNSSGKVVVFE